MKIIKYLFGTTRGLILVAIALVSLVTGIWGTLSGPMVEWGVKDLTIRILGMDLNPLERAGRIIMLYHSIAMAIVAIEVYMILSIVPVKQHHRKTITTSITIGYIAAMLGGLGFAYFGHNYILHGVFIAGQSIIFFAGVMLAVALWPWNPEFYVRDEAYAHTRKGVDLERVAFFVMAVATLGSSIYGAIAGAMFGNGFNSFLAEDVIREPHKYVFQRAVIGHLHIMLTLIAVAITLIVSRWVDFKGFWHKISMQFFIWGTIIITLGVWSIIPAENIAHKIIYVGSGLILLGALFLVIFTWSKLIKEHKQKWGVEKGGFLVSLKALLADPLRFGATWQMVFMNFVVTFVGIFMAVKLEEVMRVWMLREERITLTGHWHVLAAIIATIILLYYGEILELKGWKRKLYGWLIIIFSDMAFIGATLYSLKRLFMPEILQEQAAHTQMLMIEIGLGTILLFWGIVMLWRLIDLLRKKGFWKKEFSNPELPVNPTSKTS